MLQTPFVHDFVRIEKLFPGSQQRLVFNTCRMLLEWFRKCHVKNKIKSLIFCSLLPAPGPRQSAEHKGAGNINSSIFSRYRTPNKFWDSIGFILKHFHQVCLQVKYEEKMYISVKKLYFLWKLGFTILEDKLPLNKQSTKQYISKNLQPNYFMCRYTCT